MKKQAHIFYSGRVQGVGFRFTAESTAIDLAVTGWVKNLSDGRVEVVAEAEENVLKNFIKKIYDYFSQYISDIDIEWNDASEELKDFRIRF